MPVAPPSGKCGAYMLKHAVPGVDPLVARRGQGEKLNLFHPACPFSFRFRAYLFVMTMKPIYPHIVCSLGFACAFAALAASAHGASDKNSGKSHRIAETQQENTITGTNGRQSTVKSTTQFLTGPEARISPAQNIQPDSDGPRYSPPLRGPADIAAANLEAKAQYQLAEILQSQKNPEAIAMFEKAAAAGSAFAYYRLACIYRKGELGVEKDMDKALFFYKKGADKRDLACLQTLGELYAEGADGIEANASKSAEYFTIGADSGVGCPMTKAFVQAKVGEFYATGAGLPKDSTLAIKYLESADKLISLGKSQTTLGRLYLEKGEKAAGTETANQYFRKAVEQLEKNKSDCEALFLLSKLHVEGKGVAQNESTAAALLEEAAAKGSLAAKFEIERPPLPAGDTPPDEAAVTTIIQAAEAGSPQAQFELASILLEGRGVKKNSDRALVLLKAAAKQGNIDATFLLGKNYLAGSCVRQNLEKALELFEAAAAKGHPGAAIEAARICQRGQVGTPDPAKAIEFFTQAAAGGESSAHLALAKIYSSGRIAEPNPAAAAKHYLAAAKQGDTDARVAVLKFYFDQTSSEQRLAEEDGKASPSIAGIIRSTADCVLVFECAKDYAETGHPIAQYYLGLCYSQGIGVEKDPAEAIECFTKASTKGAILAL